MRRMLAQADMEGKSLYVVCSRGGLGPDPFLTGLAASGYRNSSGSFAILTAIRRASSHPPSDGGSIALAVSRYLRQSFSPRLAAPMSLRERTRPSAGASTALALTWSEAVQVKKRAKNRVGDDRLPQCARRFFCRA
jgi:hypothetical protein